MRLELKPRRKRRPGMMQFEVGATLHNRFDIEVRDAETGELRQKAQAENIILDQMWDRVCNFDDYHNRIAFGTGTGTLDPTNTTLFTYYDDMGSDLHEIHKDIVANDSHWVKKIELVPEYPEAENGFLDITEVGVSYNSGSGNLVTHAMIEDAEGNPIVVEKTDTDIVTIYATVYVQLDDTMGDNIDFTAGPYNEENVLLNYLIGDDSWPYMRWAVSLNGEGDVPRNGPAIGHKGFLMATTNTLHPSDDWTADPANAKVIADEKRFPVEEGNLEAFDVGLVDDYSDGRDGLFRSTIPLTGVFEGYDVVGEELATGDGATVRFTLPRRYIDEASLAFYLDGTETQDYSIEQYRDEAGNFAATNPADTLPNTGFGVTFTSDDAYMAVAHSGAPYITVYEFDPVAGTIGAKLSDPADTIPDRGYVVTFTSDDAYMAVAHSDPPYITVYEFDPVAGTIGAKLSDPTDAIPNNGQGVSFTSDDAYMAVAHSDPPYITVYEFDPVAGTIGAKLSDPTDAIPNTGYDVTFTSDDSYMAVAHRDAPYITVYEFDKATGTIGAKLDDPTDAIPNNGQGVSFTSDDAYMAVAHLNAPYITVYEFDKATGTIGAKLSDPADTIPGAGYGVSFTSDDKYIAVGHWDPPYITVYEFDKDSGTIGAKLSDPTDAIPGTGYGVSFTSDDSYMAVAHNLEPRITVYETAKQPYMDVIFDTAPGDGVAITYDAHLPYIPKDDNHVLDCQITIQFADANA